ncbi:ribonuclease H-like domain-containing protein [Paenibacillus thermotolerans]|uniref:ribonuclease H-like domain-containing protein n=1 Tax=Paenibacillus thermotolerans TaxID=3027807 RepID=UPI00236787E8|nr:MULTISPECIES: ribonuclease H-like domain-containing protein [unclassified Paenibacillus]
MSGLKERLGRLTRSSGAASPKQETRPSGRSAADDVRWAALGFELQEAAGGSCLIREVLFPSDHKHGHFSVGELSSIAASLSRLDPSGRELEPHRLLFLDTETTGLGQGAGNIPFMIGAGYWTKRGFTVRQFVIRHPGEEAAMLETLREMLSSASHLVTYNGRSFDWPLIKNRFVMNRLSAPKEPGHFDFLYPSRSLWRTTMPSVRLGAVEEGKLGVFRRDDVPGSMAPALYFQYLAENDPSVLEGVVRHNETDILTLLTLAVHFGKLLDGGMQLERMKTPELHRLGLWYERLGFEEDAQRVYEALAERPVSDTHPYLHDAALFYKKHKKWGLAAELWKTAVEAGRGFRVSSIEPYIELAMIYEHRYKNADEALYWTEEALRSAQTRLSLSGSGAETRLREAIADLNKRRERLLKKQRTLF